MVRFEDAAALGAWAERFRVASVRLDSEGRLVSVRFSSQPLPKSEPYLSSDTDPAPAVALVPIPAPDDEGDEGSAEHPASEYENALERVLRQGRAAG